MVPLKETAEEQLLRMIEGSQGSQAPHHSTGDPPLKRLTDALQERTVRWWRRVVPPRRGPQAADPFLWNLRLTQRLLWVLLVGLGAYVVIDLALIQPTPRLATVSVPQTEGTAVAVAPPVTLENSLKPLAEYLAAVSQRNPFTGAVGALDEPGAKTAKHQLEELASGFVVVGIDRGPNPVALIEHREQQRTYIMKVGDELNGMTVTSINAEGVVVSYEGEELLLP
jgi:hypothetical protein